MDARSIALDESEGDVLIVLVRGEQDIYTAPALRERLEQALRATRGIVVDLSAATFLDSSILGALLEARRQAQEKALGFVVALGDEPEPGVQRILEITGLVPVFPVVASREEALDTARSTTAGA
jgi:anti-sigma B factor antagonist